MEYVNTNPVDDPTLAQFGAYGRLSSDPGNDERGVTRQLVAGDRQGDRFGWEPVYYIDNDTSATNGTHRGNFHRLIGDIEAGRLRAVFAWGHDRLAREPGEFEVFMKIAKKNGVLFVDRSGVKDLSKAGDRYDARNRVNAAAYEVENMKERQREAFDQLAAEGRARWVRRPFGYTLPTTQGRKRTPPQLVPAEAAAIGQAYIDVLRQKPVMAIAREWNAAGLRTPVVDIETESATRKGGNEWTSIRVRDILLAPRNAGLREQFRTECVEGKTRVVSRTTLEGVVAEWEPIVTPDIYRGVVAMLTRRKNKSAWVRKHLLSGLAMCGKCGATVSGDSQKYRQPRRAAYVCRNPKCFGVCRSMADVDKFITAAMLNYLAEEKAVTRKPTGGIDRDKLTARLEELDGTETELGEALGAGMKFTIIKPQLDAIKAERDDINKQLDADAVRDDDAVERLLAADDIAAEWADKLTPDERRSVIDRFIAITIKPGQKGGASPFDPAFVNVERKRR